MTQQQRILRTGTMAAAVAIALAACGGGGGGSNVRPTPPPPTTPTGPGFTPNIANDASLTQVNPPTVPDLPATPAWPQTSLYRHLNLINAAGAVGAGKTGQGVAIGFIDSGVNRNHPTLTGRVTRNFVHVGSNNDLTVDDKVGHGTVVAALAAGKPALGNYLNSDGTNSGNTGMWGGGVAQDATVLSSRIISDTPPVDDGSGQGNEIRAGEGYGDFFKALNTELAGAGAKIVNNSWGGLYWADPLLTTELTNAYADFIVNRGGIIVFANGNAGRDTRYRPNPSDNASLPALSAGGSAIEKGWLTVGALDPSNPTQLTDYSQECGRAMNFCLVAPGNNVYIDPDATSQVTSGLYQGGGTSYAAPLVSGAAAVVWSAFPWMNNDQVRQTILGTARDLGATGVDPVFGWGLLDVTKASWGPGTFAWGDFTANVASGHSVFRNAIAGSGGLVKQGAGTLTLTERGSYGGTTRVEAGALDVRKGLASNVWVGANARMWGAGAFGGNVENNGLFMAGAGTPTTIAGNFLQSSNGNLGVWLGSTVSVTGSATIGGTVSILGVKSGYTTTSKETLLTANGGLSGTFAQTRAAPNVFLDATLAYDAKNVFLNIARIDVSKAIAGLGFGVPTTAGAQRMEGAMQAIDAQLATGNGGIGRGFIDRAGAFQQITSMDWADASLRSLTGQVHAANAALTQGTVDAGRRAVASRLSDLAAMPRLSGTWARDMASSGDLAQAGFDAMSLGSSGALLGQDLRIGNGVLGVAFSRTEQDGRLGAFGDSSRGLQHHTQWYAGWQRDGWQALAQLGLGGFDRFVERGVLVGTQFDRVGTRVSGDVRSLSAELGKRLDLGGFGLMPYLGATRTQVRNDGFAEAGGAGFGLRANGWTSDRSTAFAGVFGERRWRAGTFDLAVDARAEWQRTLASSGEDFAASYVGVEQWLPMAGMGLAPRGAQFGVGMAAGLGASVFRFDLSHQATPLGGNRTVGLQLRRAF